MSMDRSIRTLERRAAETQTDGDILRLRQARMRAGLESLPIASLAAAERQARDNAQAAERLAEQAEQAATRAELALTSGMADAELTTELAATARQDAERLAAALEQYPAAAGWYLALDPLQVRPLEQAAKRAAKVTRRKGGIPVQVELGDDLVYLPRERQDGSEARIRLRPVRILGDVPDAGAWSFVARLHHAPEGTLIHRLASARVLGDDALERYRARGPHCDDCIDGGKGARAWRDTFVIRHEDGRTAQLGRNCLERYTGASAEMAMHVVDTRERLTGILEEHADLDNAPSALWGPALLTYTAHLVRRERLGMASGGAAWSDALRYGLAPVDPTRRAEGRYPEAEDIARARGIVSEARAMLLPALEGERALLAAREQGQKDPTWPEGIARLAERWHNLSVIVAADAVSEDEARTAARILTWHGQAAAERERAEREASAERLAGDASAAAAELAAALADLDISAQAEGGRISLSPRALAELVTANGQADPLRELARMILQGRDAFTAPAPSGEYFAAVGQEGTWSGCTVARVIPFRSGRGHTVKLAHPQAPAALATCFIRGACSLAEGDIARLTGTAERHETFRGERQTIMARGFELAPE